MPVVKKIFHAPRPPRPEVIAKASQTLSDVLHEMICAQVAQRIPNFEVREERGTYFAGQSYGDSGFLVLGHDEFVDLAADKALAAYEG